jgi:hypothetical protein
MGEGVAMKKLLPLVLSLAACAPELEARCESDTDCPEGVCENRYCVTPEGLVPDAEAEASPDATGGGNDAVRPGPDVPTAPPTEPPTAPPTEPPTAPPTEPPTAPPTDPPTAPPTDPPTAPPTEPPTAPPTDPPTAPPTEPPTAPPGPVVVGECGDPRRDATPLWQPDGRPCLTSTTAGLWDFALDFVGVRGGGRGQFSVYQDINGESSGPSPGVVNFVDSPFDDAARFPGDYDLWQGVGLDGVVRSEFPMTVEAWVRPGFGNGRAGFVASTLNDCPSGFRRGDSTAGWAVGLETDNQLNAFPSITTPGIVGEDEQYYLFDDGPAIQNDTWAYVVVVFEEVEGVGVASAWVDGLLAGRIEGIDLGSEDNARRMHIGLRPGCYLDLYDGDLEALRVLNVALTADQIAAAPLFPPPPPPPPASEQASSP